MRPSPAITPHGCHFGIGGIDAAKLEGETGQPVADCADTEDHHVHHHGVGHVLVAGETRFHQRKTGLHEEDQEAADEHPHDIETQGNIINLVSGWAAILRKGRCGE